MEFLNEQWTVGLFSRLKSFWLDAIMGQSNEMQFIQFVLSNARLLQTFEVSVHDDSSKSVEDVSTYLAKYTNVSSRVVLPSIRKFWSLVICIFFGFLYILVRKTYISHYSSIENYMCVFY